MVATYYIPLHRSLPHCFSLSRNLFVSHQKFMDRHRISVDRTPFSFLLLTSGHYNHLPSPLVATTTSTDGLPWMDDDDLPCSDASLGPLLSILSNTLKASWGPNSDSSLRPICPISLSLSLSLSLSILSLLSLMENEQGTSTSLKDKLRQTLCLSCCFRNKCRETLHSPSSDDRPRLLRASSTWIRSRAHELPEIKDKCRHLISRIGRHHRRHSASAEFGYDPLSYALNFDEGFDDGHLDEAPLRNFSARVPVSPLQTVAEADELVKPSVPMEITCV